MKNKELALKEVYDRAISPEWGDVQFRKWVRNTLNPHENEINNYNMFVANVMSISHSWEGLKNTRGEKKKWQI